MDTKVNLKKINEVKRKLVKAIYLVFEIPTRTQEEKKLLEEILEYSLMDQCGRYEERYQKLVYHLYILNGILYKNSGSSNQGIQYSKGGYSGDLKDFEF